MPVSRGKKILDARPQSVEAGVGSVPLSSADGAASAQRGGRRVALSGVEAVATTADGVDSSTPAPQPTRFTVPAAVLQRMQQHHQNSQTSSPPTATDSNGALNTNAVKATPKPSEAPQQPRHCEEEGPVAPAKTTAPHTAKVPQPQQRPASSSSSSHAEAIGVEEVSEAQVTATLAARKTINVHHHDESTHTSVTAPASTAHNASDTTTDTVAATKAVASLAAPATATKPVIFSHRWRRQLFAKTGASHVPLPTAPAEAKDDEEEEDDFDSPFGKASVIKFGKAEKASTDFGGPRSNSSSSSVSEGSADELPDEGDDAAASELSRRQRHARRQHAHEVREKRRVQRHMSGFDEAYLQEKEAQLLHDVRAEGDEEKEESSEGSFEDEERGSSDESGSFVSGSGSVSGTEEEREEQAEETDAAPASAAAPNGGGFGALNRARQQQATAHRAPDQDITTTSSPLSGLAASVGGRSHWFDTFFFAVHENRLKKGGCHHTLLGLRGAVAIQGPCGLIGFGLGELCVNGFYLGKKQVNLWHEEHHAVLTPMRKLKTKHAQDMALPQWPSVADPVWPPAAGPSSVPSDRGEGLGDAILGRPLNPCNFTGHSQQQQQQLQGVSVAHNAASTTATAAAAEEGSEEDFMQSLQWDCEAVFGDIDWDWVEATVQSWRGLFSNKLPPILLVVQPSSSVPRPRRLPGPMRKYHIASKRSRRNRSGNSSGAYMDIPSFVAHRNETCVDLALLPSIVPAIAAQGCGCVMVLGSANIGKSTLCRFLANVLLSQHGLCYWLDLDVGQPEFGVPGQLTLSMVRRPLMRERDSRCVRTVASYFLGANTAAQCPVSAANALATLCAQAAAVAQAHPVVVNTHGWVLQTGRRVSVEALRRLRPRQVIHLYKGREEAWAADTAALLDPRNGLNADVVQRRFLVRRDAASAAAAAAAAVAQKGKSGSSGNGNGVSLLGRLPFPDSFDVAAAASSPSSPSSPVSPKASGPRRGTATTASAGPSQQWRGQVHAVCVEREESFSSLQRLKAAKGGRGRQQRWQEYFAPLLHFYAERSASDAAAAAAAAATAATTTTTAEAETTLLSAPLSSLHAIVLAERDEKARDVALFPAATGVTAEEAASAARQAHAEVAASLEHAVVAVLFHLAPADSGAAAVVRSLASLPCGFPVSCYGVVESSEEELLTGAGASAADGAGRGWIQVRVPLRPAVVRAMLHSATSSASAQGGPMGGNAGAVAGAARGTARISIAYSATLRQDTAFVDV